MAGLLGGPLSGLGAIGALLGSSKGISQNQITGDITLAPGKIITKTALQDMSAGQFVKLVKEPQQQMANAFGQSFFLSSSDIESSTISTTSTVPIDDSYIYFGSNRVDIAKWSPEEVGCDCGKDHKKLSILGKLRCEISRWHDDPLDLAELGLA